MYSLLFDITLLVKNILNIWNLVLELFTKFMKGAQVWQKMAKTLFYNESRMFHFSEMAAHQGLAKLRNDKKNIRHFSIWLILSP